MSFVQNPQVLPGLLCNGLGRDRDEKSSRGSEQGVAGCSGLRGLLRGLPGASGMSLVRDACKLSGADCMAFPGGSDGKESACEAGDLGFIPGSGRSPGEGNDHPLQHSSLENPHGQRSLAGHSARGRKQSDTTEGLTLPPQEPIIEQCVKKE